MRKGFNLVEMLIVLIVLPIISMALLGFFRMVIKDIPRSNNIVQENMVLISLIEQLDKDIRVANSLHESSEEIATDGMLMIMKMDKEVIGYQVEDDRVLRHRFTVVGEKNDEITNTWVVPHAKIEWAPWKKEGEIYALEVKHHIEYNLSKHKEKNLANSHLFFVGISKEAKIP